MTEEQLDDVRERFISLRISIKNAKYSRWDKIEEESLFQCQVNELIELIENYSIENFKRKVADY